MAKSKKTTRKTSSRKPTSRRRGRNAAPGLFRRLLQGSGILVILVVAVGVAAAAFWYLKSPKQDRSLTGVVVNASEKAGNLAESLTERLPEATKGFERLGSLTSSTGKDTPSVDPELAGALENPFVVARVIRVVDGETLLVQTGGKEERVRLLMVRLPETSRGKTIRDEAVRYMKNRLEGNQIRLQFDPDQKQRDASGRMLCYVFTDDQNLNVEMIERGLSPYYIGEGRSQSFDRAFQTAENTAKHRKTGIWGDPQLTEEMQRLKEKRADSGNLNSRETLG